MPYRPLVLPRGVNDLEAREEARLAPLLADGERSRDESLRSDDGDGDCQGEDGPVNSRVGRDRRPERGPIGGGEGRRAVEEERGLAEAGGVYEFF